MFSFHHPTALLINLLVAVLAYLLGSIPFGLLLTRMAGTPDLRGIGSGNIGATNVLRTGRKDLAAATLLLDGLKGTAAVLIGWKLGPIGAMTAAAAACLGHVFPAWLNFKGGKGVATYLGCVLGLFWPAGIVFAVVWLAMAFATRYSSAAALTASVATPVALLSSGHRAMAGVALALTVLLWWTHRANIARLRAGTEGKIGRKG